MKCPDCELPKAPEWKYVEGMCMADGYTSEALACLRRALANRDGEIATLKAAADSSFEFRARRLVASGECPALADSPALSGK